MVRARFSKKILADLGKTKILGIRAGKEHRFIGVWFVLVNDRVYVRSWNVSPEGWHATFRKEKGRGAVQVGEREVKVRAATIRSERILDAVSEAYRERYHTPASLKYVRDLNRGQCRASTTELAPSS